MITKEQIALVSSQIVEAIKEANADHQATVEKMLGMAILGLIAGEAQDRIAEESNATARVRSLETIEKALRQKYRANLFACHDQGRINMRLDYFAVSDLGGSARRSKDVSGTDLPDALAQLAVAVSK